MKYNEVLKMDIEEELAVIIETIPNKRSEKIDKINSP